MSTFYYFFQSVLPSARTCKKIQDPGSTNIEESEFRFAQTYSRGLRIATYPAFLLNFKNQHFTSGVPQHYETKIISTNSHTLKIMKTNSYGSTKSFNSRQELVSNNNNFNYKLNRSVLSSRKWGVC